MLPVLVVAVLAAGGAIALRISPAFGHGKHKAGLLERIRRH